MTQPIPPLMSTAQAAAELGISRRRVQALAQARQLGRRIGRDILLTPADVDAMRVRLPGRPRRIMPTATADAVHESVGHLATAHAPRGEFGTSGATPRTSTDRDSSITRQEQA